MENSLPKIQVLQQQTQIKKTEINKTTIPAQKTGISQTSMSSPFHALQLTSMDLIYNTYIHQNKYLENEALY